MENAQHNSKSAYIHKMTLYSCLLHSLLGLTSCLSTTSNVPIYEEVAAAAGITHESTTDPSADTGGGAAWIDVNNDGYQDLFIPNPEAGGSWLYKNNGNGTFSEIASAAGAQVAGCLSTGVVVGDVNADGCDDLYVTNGGNTGTAPAIFAQKNQLLINNFCSTGKVGFTDVTDAAGLGEEILNSMVASFGDVDNDGDLDLYVGNYLPGGNMYSDHVVCDENRLYLNNGNGQFKDISSQSGVNNFGCTLGTVFTDYDNDGDLDLFVTNDFTGASSGGISVDVRDGIYRNFGTRADGIPIFSLASDANMTDAPNGMGIAVGDYDGDADLDYYVTSFAVESGPIQNVLHRNNGDGTFTNVADTVGAADRGGYRELGGLRIVVTVGWGAVFADLNNDGYLDLYKSNGRIQGGLAQSRLELQPNALFINDTKGGFIAQGFNKEGIFIGHTLDGKLDARYCPYYGDSSVCYGQGRGTAVADYDNDGDLDIIVINSGQIGGQHPQLFKSTLNDGANRSNWLQLRLQGRSSNARGIGAKVTVTSGAGSRANIRQVQELAAGTSHGSSNALNFHFWIRRCRFGIPS